MTFGFEVRRIGHHSEYAFVTVLPAEQLDVRFPYSHVRMRREDCATFELQPQGPGAPDGSLRPGTLRVDCRLADGADELHVDLAFNRCDAPLSPRDIALDGPAPAPRDPLRLTGGGP
jgi:hypothetical protein